MAFTDLTTWSSDPRHIFSSALPFASTDLGRTVRISGGTGWLAADYIISAVYTSYNTGAQGTQTLVKLSSAPAVAGATVGLGDFFTPIGGTSTARTDLITWTTNNFYIFSVAQPYVASDVGKTLNISGGTGWTTGNYTITAINIAYNLGAQGTQNVAKLSAAPAAASTAGGQGDFVASPTPVATVGKADLVTWTTNNFYVFSVAKPFTVADLNRTLRITGGTGWTTGDYTITTVSTAYNLGAQGIQNIAKLITPAAAATTSGGQGDFIDQYIITEPAPASTAVGVVSSNYTVTLTGSSAVLAITPSDNSAGGAFSPTSASISTGAPTVNFTYTPAVAGRISFTWSNDQLLSVPTTKYYGGVRSFIIDGNSIASGYNSIPMTTYLAAILGKTWKITNVGSPSYTTAACLSRVATTVDNKYDPTNKLNIIAFWEITNHLGQVTKEVAYSTLITYCLGRKALGFTVGVFTVLPRLDTSQEPQRVWINQKLRDTYLQFADFLIDVDSDERFNDQSKVNSTYFADQVHPNPTGQAIFANNIAHVLSSIDAGVLKRSKRKTTI